MFCSKCGAKLPDDSKFCIRCGAKLTPAVSVTLNPAANAPVPPVAPAPTTPAPTPATAPAQKAAPISAAPTPKAVSPAPSPAPIMPPTPTTNSKPPKKKKHIGRILLILLLLLLLIGGIGFLVKHFLLDKGDKDKKEDTETETEVETDEKTESGKNEDPETLKNLDEVLSSLIKVNNIQITGEGEEKLMTAGCSAPDIAEFLRKFLDEKDLPDYSDEEASKLLAEFLEALQKEKFKDANGCTVTVNLYEAAFDIVYSVEYLDKADKVIAPEEYEFSDSELEALARNAYLRTNLKPLLDEQLDGIEWGERGIIPEWYDPNEEVTSDEE